MTKKIPTIGALLTPRIGRLNTSYCAGTERVFLDDVANLRSTGYTVVACARGEIISSHIAPIFYPKHLARFAESIFDLFFVVIFSIKTRHCQKLLGYSVPLLALARPAKTIVIMQTEYDVPLARICAHRYLQSQFMFCSRSMKLHYEKKYPWLRNAFGLLYNATDTTLFRPPTQRAIPNGRYVRLLFTGAWVPEKGLHVLLEAFLSLPTPVRRRVRLTITSDHHLWYTDTPKIYAAYIRYIQRLLQKMGNIELLGGVAYTCMPHVYGENDALVFPSLWNEPFGLTVLESLACGTPVIAFPSGGVKEIVDTTNSILVKEKNPQALAAAIQTFLQSPLRKQTKTTSLLTIKNQDMVMNVRLQKLRALIA